MGWVRALGLIRYGNLFQRHRRMVHEYLTPKKSLTYQPVQTRESYILLKNLLLDESGREDHIQRCESSSRVTLLLHRYSRFSAAIIIDIVFGHQISSGDDPYIKIAEDACYALNNCGSPGSTPVDFFPFRERNIILCEDIDPKNFPKSSTFLRGFPVHIMPPLLRVGKERPGNSWTILSNRFKIN